MSYNLPLLAKPWYLIVMKKNNNSNNVYKYILPLAFCVALVSCSSESQDQEQHFDENQNSSIQTPSENQIQRQRPSQPSQPTPQANQNQRREVVRLENPKIETREPVFRPSVEDVMGALVDTLVETAINIPQSEERDQWYAQEVGKIENLSVNECSVSRVGTPSECHIVLGGESGVIKLLLTQRGWQIVN